MDEKYFFHDLIDQLAFLEPSLEKKDGLIGKLGHAPIPIFQMDILKEVERQKKVDTLDYESILRGLFAIVSIDDTFPYWDKYIDLIKNLGEDILSYLEVKKNQALGKNEIEWAYIYGKTKYLLTENIDDLFRLTLIMENIYNDRWIRKKEEDLPILSDLLKDIEGNYEKILTIRENDSLAYERLAYLYIAKEQYVRARLYLEKALHGNGKEDELERIRENLSQIENHAYLEAAESYMVYNRFEETIHELNKIKESDFLPARVNHHKGMSYYGLKKYDLAVEFLKQAYEMDPKNYEIQNDLSVALAGVGKIEEAIEVLNKSIKDNPESRDLFYNRAVLYFNIGRVEESIKDFKKAYALQADPELWNLIQSLEKNV